MSVTILPKRGIALLLYINCRKSSPERGGRQKEKIMDSNMNSFYSTSLGYVIDGRHFGHDIDRASNYLVEETFMEPEDAYSYLSRLARSFIQSVRKIGVSA